MASLSQRCASGLCFALIFVGCGGRTPLDSNPGETRDTVDAGDAGAIGDATTIGDATALGDATTIRDGAIDGPINGGRGPAPVPTCTGTTQCGMNDGGTYSGEADITCDPVSFVGPWDLILERSITGPFQTIQSRAVSTPGFGTKFVDTTVKPSALTYRVCVVDDLGTRCGAPFTTDPPPNCACEALTCSFVRACDTALFDGCGSYRQCGACSDGTTCNTATRSCCPDGFMSNGNQGCVCAPPGPCPGRLVWDVQFCRCDVIEP